MMAKSMKTKLRDLIGVTYTIGYYASDEPLGKPVRNKYRTERDRLWRELEKDIDDLLEACKMALNDDGIWMMKSETEQKIREAIAKAEGRT